MQRITIVKAPTKWSTGQAKALAKAARTRAGAGWALLSPALRQALVSREVLNMLTSQADEARFGAVDVMALEDAAMAAAGIDTTDIHG